MYRRFSRFFFSSSSSSSFSSSSSSFSALPQAQLPFVVPEGVSCRVTPSAGRSLFATKSFKRGDVIVSEEPLFALHGEDFETWLPRFAALPKDVRDVATKVLFVPSLEIVQQMVPPASKGQSVLPLIESLNSGECVHDGLSDKERANVVLMLTSLAFFSDALYVFPVLSLVNHTCGLPNATALEKTLVATQDINPGEELLLNYHPANLLMDRDSRRYRLRLTKYFHCNCVRCTSGVDWTGGLPCPHCNQRSHGLLTALDGPSVCRDLAEGDEVWRCGECKQAFGREDFGTLSPPALIQNEGITLFEEFDKVYDLMKAVENLACWSQHTFLNSNYDMSPPLPPFVLPLDYVQRVLGNHHWASHILAAIHALHEPSFDALKHAAVNGAAWARAAPPNGQYNATQDSHFNHVLLRLLQHGSAQRDPEMAALEAELVTANLSLPGFS